MACNPNWRNCQIAEAVGAPCILPGHDTRTQEEKINDDHDMALSFQVVIALE